MTSTKNIPADVPQGAEVFVVGDAIRVIVHLDEFFSIDDPEKAPTKPSPRNWREYGIRAHWGYCGAVSVWIEEPSPEPWWHRWLPWTWTGRRWVRSTERFMARLCEDDNWYVAEITDRGNSMDGPQRFMRIAEMLKKQHRARCADELYAQLVERSTSTLPGLVPAALQTPALPATAEPAAPSAVSALAALYAATVTPVGVSADAMRALVAPSQKD